MCQRLVLETRIRKSRKTIISLSGHKRTIKPASNYNGNSFNTSIVVPQRNIVLNRFHKSLLRGRDTPVLKSSSHHPPYPSQNIRTLPIITMTTHFSHTQTLCTQHDKRYACGHTLTDFHACSNPPCENAGSQCPKWTRTGRDVGFACRDCRRKKWEEKREIWGPLWKSILGDKRLSS